MEEETTVPAVTEQQIHTIASPVVEDIEKVTPVTIMENSLSTFMTDVFNQVREEEDYQKKIKEQIVQNLPTMKNSELIALMTSASTNKNDLISKVIAPTMGLMTAAQQNELAERKEAAKEKQVIGTAAGDITQVSTIVPGEVLVGLKGLFDIATTFAKNPPKQEVTEDGAV